MTTAQPTTAARLDRLPVTRLHRYLIEAESISVVSDQMRTVVETEWPALAHKLPPKDSAS